MPGTMVVPHTAAVIADCWQKAEKAVRSLIRRKYYDADEEMITFLTAGELRHSLASEKNRLSLRGAFRRDLEDALGGESAWFDLDEYSDVVGNVVFHSRVTESRTGGDFGLVLNRPEFSFGHYGAAYRRGKLTRNGVLCQAKISQRKKLGYGKLRKSQTDSLLQIPNAFALVLYGYTDEDRTRLQSFKWFPCKGAEPKRIADYLGSEFPSKFLLSSSEAIQALARGELGTGDETLIDSMIAPKMRSSMEIVISWRSGTPPDDLPAHAVRSARHKVKVPVYVTVGRSGR